MQNFSGKSQKKGANEVYIGGLFSPQEDSYEKS